MDLERVRIHGRRNREIEDALELKSVCENSIPRGHYCEVEGVQGLKPNVTYFERLCFATSIAVQTLCRPGAGLLSFCWLFPGLTPLG